MSIRTLLTVAVVSMVLPVSAEVVDRVLAIVEGRVIMLSDVVAARDLG